MTEHSHLSVLEGEQPRHPVMRFLIAEDWTDGTLKGLKDDIFAGITLTMTQVPPAVAYSIIAKMNPLTGLYTSFFIGVILSIFGGRPGAISATAGALAVVYPDVVLEHGADAIHLAAIIAGVLMALPGVFRVASLVRMMPAPVMIGFVNGLGIILAMKQVDSFKDASGEYVVGAQAGYTALLCIITFGIMFALPYATKVVPSTFVAIVVATAIEHIFRLGTVTVADLYSLSGAFPSPRVPSVDFGKSGALGSIVNVAIVLAIIGIIESLVGVQVLNVLTETQGSFERESLAIGAACIVCGFFQGFAGCGVIGPSILNFASGGGRRRVSALIIGIMMIVTVLAISTLIGWLPMGSLAAVLFGIAIKTFDWRTLDMIFFRKVPITDSVVILATTLTAVFTDLAVAIGVGLGLSVLFFVWDMGRGRVQLRVEEEEDAELGLRVKVVHMTGTLFFASTLDFAAAFEQLQRDGVIDGADVIIDFGLGRATVHDFTAVDTVQELALQFAKHKRRLHLRNIDPASSKIVLPALEFAPDVARDDPALAESAAILTRVKPPSVDRSPMSPASPEVASSPAASAADASAFLGAEPSVVIPAEALEREELLRDLRLTVYAHSATLGISVPVSMTPAGWRKWRTGHRHGPIENHVSLTTNKLKAMSLKGEAISKSELDFVHDSIGDLFE